MVYSFGDSPSTGKVVQTTDYYPYGGVRHEFTDENFENDFLYTGKEMDEELGVYYYGARYYNADIGRFMGQDPLFLKVGSSEFLDEWRKNWRNINSEKSNYHGSCDSISADGYDNKMALGEYLSGPQSLNLYSYVINNPLKFIDPTGKWEVHFSPVIPGVNIGLGGEFGNSWTVGFASDGTFGLSSSVHGGGLAGVDASINWTVGYSNAKTWSDTLGTDNYVQVGGKIGAGLSISTNYSDGEYTGTDINFGLGARGMPDVPVAFSGGTNKTVPVFSSNVKEVVNSVKSGLNAVKNMAESSANSVKHYVSNVSNYVKSKVK